jgi:O-acetyl-ADP-ribose deacetylase (regulator of RNase III)
MNLFHVIGDATKPVKIPAVIAHVCNDVGAFGAGFVVCLGAAFPKAKQAYLSVPPTSWKLGHTQFVDVGGGIVIANMIAQRGIKRIKGIPPIRYNSLHTCLETVQALADKQGLTVHLPRIAAGLAGGDWSVVKSVIMATMKVDTYVYTLQSEADKWPETRKDGQNG